METAAIVAVALIGAVTLFQVALAGGVPWGAAAWGGQNPGVLPGRLRIASGFSVLLLVFAAWVILAKAGVTESSPIPEGWLGPAAWAITGYFILGVFANLASRSKPERLWALVSAATSVCSGLVAAA